MRKTKKIKYTNKPLGKLKVIPDFLPSPDKFVLKEKPVKVIPEKLTRAK